MGKPWWWKHGFFHSVAAIRNQKNTIASLSRADGSIVVDHNEKAGILWQAYKDILGFSTPIDKNFDFSSFIQQSFVLDDLYAHFT